jgi:coatomer subunit beta'
MGNSDGMAALAATAAAAGKTNVAFLALLLCGRVEECLELLISAGRLPEAAFMARTYLPSEVPRLVAMWKDDLKTVSVKAAEALADPEKYPNMFEVYTVYTYCSIANVIPSLFSYGSCNMSASISLRCVVMS